LRDVERRGVSGKTELKEQLSDSSEIRGRKARLAWGHRRNEATERIFRGHGANPKKGDVEFGGSKVRNQLDPRHRQWPEYSGSKEKENAGAWCSRKLMVRKTNEKPIEVGVKIT